MRFDGLGFAERVVALLSPRPLHPIYGQVVHTVCAILRERNLRLPGTGARNVEKLTGSRIVPDKPSATGKRGRPAEVASARGGHGR